MCCNLCHFWVVFMVNIIRRISGKLRRIILLHLGFWTSNFPISLLENPQTPHSMISGFGDVSLSPDTNIIYFLRPNNTSNKSKKHPTLFQQFHKFRFQDFEIPQNNSLRKLTVFFLCSLESLGASKVENNWFWESWARPKIRKSRKGWVFGFSQNESEKLSVQNEAE